MIWFRKNFAGQTLAIQGDRRLPMFGVAIVERNDIGFRAVGIQPLDNWYGGEPIPDGHTAWAPKRKDAVMNLLGGRRA